MITLTITQIIFIIISCTILGTLLSWSYFEQKQIKEFKKLDAQTKVSQGIAEGAISMYRHTIAEQVKEIKELKEKLESSTKP